MTAVSDMSVHRETFNRLKSKFPGSRQDWVQDLRRDNLDRFESMGYPTTRLEAWKKLNLRPITQGSFELATSSGNPSKSLPANLVRHTVCFVDGHFSPDLSDIANLPQGIRVRTLSTALEQSDTDSLPSFFGQAATDEKHAFLALNGALFTDGAIVEIDDAVAEPVSLRFIQTDGADPRVTYTRVLVRVAPQAQVDLIEEFVGEGKNLTNHVTEVVVGENAGLRHLRFQDESQSGFHLGVLGYVLERNARLESFAVSLGAALSRVDGHVSLQGEGAEANLQGLYTLRGDQVCDHHTLLHHRVPHTHSQQLYKGILAHSARAIFNGQVTIDKDAQKTTADQQNPNLLLSDQALVNTNPQLEIYADDVQCRHGATVGQMDEDSLFYLRSRGIPKDQAVRLLMQAFAAEVVEAIPNESVRDQISERVRERFFSSV
ncbi:MAG: Fe-S cluster assembly protein SufD [Candidatus Eisenbacteria bacterium]|uniref:Fe-S cluster assembly protein SufD n=1 Tax=Eiseniibacteriota bacterium TaxID=2212470 RepID=A0A7Y2H148_UNCEI|nr:Fe-S cluster assembly protein SufD [Candidatus Eisenbacteria bacterium]